VSGVEVIPRIPTTYRRKYYYRFSGIGVDVRYGVHAHNLTNARRAVAERVMFVPDGAGGLKAPPRPADDKSFKNMMLPFERAFRERVTCDSSFPIPPLRYDQFVDSYHGAKKKRYQEAVDSLVRDPIVRRDAHVNSFVKVEKINFTAKPDPCPRLIQPRTFRFGAALGRHIKHVEKPLFSKIADVFGGSTVLKGMDCIAVAHNLEQMWNRFDNPVAVGLDASRFDQHCSKSALKWEHSIWELLCTDKHELRQLLAMQLENVGRVYTEDGIIKYRTDGCRMSGDMNTSSGNCLLMCAMVYSFCKSVGLEEFRLANNGDDCVLVLDKRDLFRLATLQKWFTRAGYTMKVEEPVTEFERIVFCQTQPVFDGLGYRMVRDPRVSMSKDLTSTLNCKERHVRERWMAAMRCGGQALTNGIPILGHFYRMYPDSKLRVSSRDTITASISETGMWMMIPKVTQQVRDITARSRYSFWLAFGITPDNQLLLERRFELINLGNVTHTDQGEYCEVSYLVDSC